MGKRYEASVGLWGFRVGRKGFLEVWFVVGDNVSDSHCTVTKTWHSFILDCCFWKIADM